MKTLLQEINNILEAKNDTIKILEWEKSFLKDENMKLRDEIKELTNDIEKYKENEANRV